MIPLAFCTGIIAGAISAIGLWAVAYFMTRKFDPNLQPPLSPPVLIIALLFKLPALAIGYQVSVGLGTAGPPAFGAGIVLVYCLAVVRWNSQRDH
jgi:hypothetical protein